MIIRGPQLKAFEAASVENFQNRLAVHIRQHFPVHAEILGDETIRRVIRQGCARAGDHGFTTEHEVYLFVDLMIMLGSGFPTDPQLPWAANILADQEAATDRIDRLYARALTYLDGVVGPTSVFPILVYRRFCRLTWDEIQVKFTRDPVTQTQRFFAELWPEKYGAIGPDTVRVLSRRAETIAGTRFPTSTDRGVLSTFMFLVGHDVDGDPLYQPVFQRLEGPDGRGQPRPALRLVFEDVVTLLTKVLETP